MALAALGETDEAFRTLKQGPWIAVIMLTNHGDTDRMAINDRIQRLL